MWCYVLNSHMGLICEGLTYDVWLALCLHIVSVLVWCENYFLAHTWSVNSLLSLPDPNPRTLLAQFCDLYQLASHFFFVIFKIFSVWISTTYVECLHCPLECHCLDLVWLWPRVNLRMLIGASCVPTSSSTYWIFMKSISMIFSISISTFYL